MGERPEDFRSVANYILLVRNHFGLETTNLEIQKIAYFCYSRYLVKHGERLFDGNFEAWEHGPVHPTLYREFKHLGASPIRKLIEGIDLISGASKRIPMPKDPERRAHIAEVVLSLKDLTAWQLREKSHVSGGPWHSVWQSAKINLASSAIIPDDVIREDFKRHISVATTSNGREEPSFEDIPPKPTRGGKY